MRSSHTIDIGALLAGGRNAAVDDAIPVDPFEGLTFPRPANVHLELRGSRSALEIAGTVDIVARGECGRCLEEVELPVHVEVDERLEVSPTAQADPFGESNVLTGERLDVGDLTKQVVCSAVPLGLLCSQECAGICPACGVNNNTGVCKCRASDEEQRWQT